MDSHVASPDPIVNLFYYHQLLANEFYGPRPATLPDPPVLLQGDVKLTLSPGRKNGAKQCSNSKFHHGMWLTSPIPNTPKSYRNVGFLTHLGLFCAAAKVRECNNKRCREIFTIMDGAAPPCAWIAFRNWALVAMSCQQSLATSCRESLSRSGEKKSLANGDGMSRAHTHLVHAVHGCYWILESSRAVGQQFQPTHDGFSSAEVDLREVCNVIYWMVNIQAFKNLGAAASRRWDHFYLPGGVTSRAIQRATEKIRDLDLCRCRFWSLVNLAERKQSDLPDIVESLNQTSRKEALRHPEHKDCTPTKCQFSNINSTKVEQLHKCTDSNCEQPEYPMHLLATALELGEGSAWSRNSLKLSPPGAPYIAISHVWSDGTGIGVKQQGKVNQCLFKYFARIAESLGCDGLWWDALSIPLEPKTRAKAINQMHKNYANAKYTVVHDQYLLNIQYTDPETASLAIVLSPWFTRGWTALELRMGTQVKVLFRGSDPSTPVMKDLEQDILAKDPGSVSRAHWLASSMISRLRTRAIEYIDDVLAILRPRSTSWVRDRTTIAGLLIGVRCDYSRSEGEITCDIIRHLGSVPHSALLHGMPTMRETGSFSWCSATLDEMPIDLCVDLDQRTASEARRLRVSVKGAVRGRWYCEVVTQRQIRNKRLEPHGDHISVAVYFYNALLHWENCLILRERKGDHGPALLVATVGMDKEGGFIDCRYVGAARISEDDQAEDSDNDRDNDSDDADGGQKTGDKNDGYFSCEVDVRIGSENGQPDHPSRSVIDEWLTYRDGLKTQPPESPGPNVDPNTSPAGLSNKSGDQRGRNFIELFKRRSRRTNETWYKSPEVSHYEPPLYEPEEPDNDELEPTEIIERRLHQAFRSGNAKGLLYLLISQRVGISSRVENRLSFNDMSLLSSVYFANDMPTEAQGVCQHALQALPKTIRPEDGPTLKAMCVLAKVCSKVELCSEAQQLYQCAIEKCIPTAIQQRKIQFQAIGELALFLAGLGQMRQASARYQDALKGFGKLPGPVYAFAYDNPSRLNRPYFQRHLEDSEAERVYRRANREFEKEVGNHHAVTLITTLNIAATILHQGEISEAEEMLDGVIPGLEKDAGPYHVLTLRAKLERARIYVMQRRITNPEQLADLQQACERSFGRQHWLSRLANLTSGGVYENLGQLEDAIPPLQRAQDEPVSQDAPDLYLVACAKRDLGIVHARLGKLEEAENECQGALQELRRLARPENVEEYVTLFCLGAIKEAQADVGSAEQMFRESLPGLERLCGPTDTETREVVSKLGRLCRPMVADIDEASGDSNEHTLRAIHQLSQLLERCGDVIGSKGRLERELQGYEEVFTDIWNQVHVEDAFDRADVDLEDDEIMVSNVAIAIDQFEWNFQANNLGEDDDVGDDLGDYPNSYSVTAQDVAGKVVGVGSKVTRFQEGDYVLGHAIYSATQDKRHQGFQGHTVLLARMASPIPRTLSLEHAAVLPLGVSTAAAGLFQKGYLELPPPSLYPKRISDKALLVMDGTTSVGTNAIQLAMAAGCQVIATALPKNFDYVKRLGASQVVNSQSPKVVDELIRAFGQKQTAGAFDTAGSEEAIQTATAVLKVTPGKRIIVSLSNGHTDPSNGIARKFVTAADIRDNEVSDLVYERFLPQALAGGKYHALPDPVILGGGFGSIQASLEAGKKLVILV